MTKEYMTESDIVNLVSCMVEGENKNFEKYIKNNPCDEQRKRDHAIILSVYERFLFEVKDEFRYMKEYC